MDCYFFIVATIIIFFLMLFFPQTAICGASLGLMLWFQTVLPVLLPFLILTALLLKSNGFFLISRLVRPILHPLFGISDYGSFALLVGFLCGYPMGSKVTADLKREGKITVNEASYLLSFCNQTSPMFLISYIFYIHLKRPDLLFPGMLLIEGVPILMSIPFRKIYCPAVTSSASSPSPHFAWNMLDDCIMQSFETITKIGGYIIIFSVFLQFGKELPFTHPLLTFLFLPSLEITNGIALICNSGVPTDLAFVLATGLASFGGWCSVAQTYSMIRGSGLSIGDYIAKKLIITGITSLLAYIYIYCF